MIAVRNAARGEKSEMTILKEDVSLNLVVQNDCKLVSTEFVYVISSSYRIHPI